MTSDIATIRQKIVQLRKMDDRQFRVFGASTHWYELHPRLSERQLCAIERQYDITLPEEYRLFLREIGNGGAGPAYGIAPLERSIADVTPQFLAHTFPHRAAWNWEQEPALACIDRSSAQGMKYFDDLYCQNRYVQGALPINHQGCGYYTLLVINGPERGMLWSDDRTSEMGISPLGSPNHPKERLGFLAWYEYWLDASIKSCQRPPFPSWYFGEEMNRS